MPKVQGVQSTDLRREGFFIEPDTDSVTLLPEVAFSCRINDAAALPSSVLEFGDWLGDEVLMLHRASGQERRPSRRPLRRPEAAGVDGVRRAPCPCPSRRPRRIRALSSPSPCSAFRWSPHPCARPWQRRGWSPKEVAVERIVERAEDAVGSVIGANSRILFGAEDLGVQAHVRVLGAFRLEHVEPVLRVGQRQAADVVQAAGHAGDLFQLLVEVDRIALKGGHVGVAVERAQVAAGGVPGGPRGKSSCARGA